jgi:hypothetical protein
LTASERAEASYEGFGTLLESGRLIDYDGDDNDNDPCSLFDADNHTSWV